MWFKIDDGWSENPKVRIAAELGGPAAIALWAVVGSTCAKNSTEGVAGPLLVKDGAYRAGILGPDVLDGTVRALVEAGLWHDTRTVTRCASCKPLKIKLPASTYYFHDWLDYQFTKDVAKVPEHRRRHNRGKALNRDSVLRETILDRDGTLCRYCGCRVDFRDRRGLHGGTYDHVDPDGPNTLDNVVVACRRCNSLKNNRTPDEAAMPLLDPGTRA